MCHDRCDDPINIHVGTGGLVHLNPALSHVRVVHSREHGREEANVELVRSCCLVLQYGDWGTQRDGNDPERDGHHVIWSQEDGEDNDANIVLVGTKGAAHIAR